MSGVRLSPARWAACALLAALTAWYGLGVARNTTPHGADRDRWERPTLPAVP